ncbi:MAG: hypothetical protein J5I90_12805 [Caldilineales bacterium]|nr:hypothetical protein [Caldilineales bacterium]
MKTEPKHTDISNSVEPITASTALTKERKDEEGQSLFVSSSKIVNVRRSTQRVGYAWTLVVEHLPAHDQSGSAMVYFAIMLFVLVGFAGIAIDGSNGFMNQRMMQNAADAAALAGAKVLATTGSSTGVGTAVNSFSSLNGAESATWSLVNSNKGVAVTTSVTFDTWFAGMLGSPVMTATASSEATFYPIVGTGNLLPMSVSCETRTFGQLYDLWVKDDHLAPGNVGWLDWNGGSRGNSELVDALLNPGSSGIWHIGDWVYGSPGVQSSSGVRDALDYWIGKHVTVPMYDSIEGNGANTQYRICGFAEFVLQGYDMHGNDGWVRGHFIRHVDVGGIPGNAVDYGVRVLQFTQ